MVKICLMASHGYLPGIVLHPELGSCKVSKDCPSILQSPGSAHEMIKLGTLNARPHQSEKPWKPISGFSETTQFVKVDSTITKPVLIDVQDTRPNSTLFSFGIDGQCTRHEEILQFLMAGSKEVDAGGLDLSMISDLLGLQAFTINNIHQNPFSPDCGSCTHGAVHPSLIYPSIEFDAQRQIFELVGDLARRSEMTLYPDGRFCFRGASTKFKDILSVVAEHYLPKNSTKWTKQSALIPHFNRLDWTEAGAQVHESNRLLENVTFAPLKSPGKIKSKPSPKKKTHRKGRERDLYGKNYFHACECLLSIMMDKKRNGKIAILSLKKSGPELPELLMQFSASVAGTGLAVLFSVIYKVGYSRLPFCAYKLLNTGIGFGLVWLSWAVNKLRDAVVNISKNSGKLSLKEEEMSRKLDRCVNEVYFRAATLMAVAVLRLV